MFIFKHHFSSLLFCLWILSCSIPVSSRLTDPTSDTFLSNTLLSLILNVFPHEMDPSPGVLTAVPANISLRSNLRDFDVSDSTVSVLLNGATYSDYVVSFRDGNLISISFLNRNWQGILELNYQIKGKGQDSILTTLTKKYTIDSSAPSVVVTNRLGDYPKFLNDRFIELQFSEKVSGADNPNHYQFSGSAKGSLVVVNSVRISDTIYRLSFLGSPDSRFSSLSLGISNIKDTNDTNLNQTLNFKIPIIREVGEVIEPRTFAQCVKTDSNTVFVIGGWKNGTPVRTIEKVNLTTYATEVIGNLGIERVFFSATLANNGRILVTGGLRGADGATTRLNTAEWITVSPFSVANATFTLPTNRYYHESVLTDDGNIFLFGGQATNANSQRLATTLFVNPEIPGTIQSGPSISSGREGLAWAKFQSKLWISAGENTSGVVTNLVESISMTSPYTYACEPSASPCAGFSVPRSLHRMVATDQNLTILGGRSGIALSEKWNANLSRFQSLSLFDNGTVYGGAVVFEGQNILDIGGYLQSPIESQTINSVKLIDPQNATVVQLSPLKTARYGHCVIPVSQSKVVVIGGSQGDTSRQNSRDTSSIEVIEYNE